MDDDDDDHDDDDDDDDDDHNHEHDHGLGNRETGRLGNLKDEKLRQRDLETEEVELRD